MESINEKKSNLEKLLSKKNYGEILEEINKEMLNNTGELNAQIQEFLNHNDTECSKLFKEAKELITKFVEGKRDINLSKTEFKNYMSKKIGDEKKDLGNQIFEEIKNTCESLSNIYAKKGFKEWFCSLFSSISYLQNIIDMVVDTFAKKIEYILKIVSTESENYLNDGIRNIEHNVKSATLEFDDEQLKKWKELCDSYQKTREIIMEMKIKK